MLPTHPRRRLWATLPLLLTALLLALVVVVLVAPPVRAGALGGVEPSNYRTRVLAARPPVPGLSVEVVAAGLRLSQLRLPRQPGYGLPEDLDPSFDPDLDPDPLEPAPPAGATVLPWPGPRRPDGDTLDDPDLPGGA